MTVSIPNIVKAINDDMTGGTVRLVAVGYPLPEDGYFIGGAVPPLVIEPDDLGADNIGQIEEFIGGLKTPFLGWWTDEDDNQLYLDGVTWTADYDVAEALCRDRGEIAFWDIARKREFRPVQKSTAGQ